MKIANEFNVKNIQTFVKPRHGLSIDEDIEYEMRCIRADINKLSHSSLNDNIIYQLNNRITNIRKKLDDRKLLHSYIDATQALFEEEYLYIQKQLQSKKDLLNIRQEIKNEINKYCPTNVIHELEPCKVEFIKTEVDKMQIEKEEIMSFQDFLEKKDESFYKTTIRLDEERVEELSKNYGIYLSNTYPLSDDTVIKIFPESIKLKYPNCRDDVIPLSFIKDVEVVVRY